MMNNHTNTFNVTPQSLALGPNVSPPPYRQAVTSQMPLFAPSYAQVSSRVPVIVSAANNTTSTVQTTTSTTNQSRKFTVAVFDQRGDTKAKKLISVYASSCAELIQGIRARTQWTTPIIYWVPTYPDVSFTLDANTVDFDSMTDAISVAPSSEGVEHWMILGPDSHIAEKCMLIKHFQKKHGLTPLLENDHHLFKQVSRLVEKIEDEFWYSKDMTPDALRYNVELYLYYYLHFTFQRQLHESKVHALRDPSNFDGPYMLVWNTGLVQRKRQSCMICVMIRSDVYQYVDSFGKPMMNYNPFSSGTTYQLYSFWEGHLFHKMLHGAKQHLASSVPQSVKQALDKITYEDVLPADYFSSVHEKNELHFSKSLPIKLRKEYLLDNKNRLDPKFVEGKSDNEILTAVEGAAKMSIAYARLHSRTAVPFYYTDPSKGELGRGHIQWVIPLSFNLNNPLDAHCGLVLRYDPELKHYDAITALDRDVVLKKTRLLQQPDTEWLQTLWEKEKYRQQGGTVNSTAQKFVDVPTRSEVVNQAPDIEQTVKPINYMVPKGNPHSSGNVTPRGIPSQPKADPPVSKKSTKNVLVVKNVPHKEKNKEAKEALKKAFSLYGHVSSVVLYWGMIFVNMKDPKSVDACMKDVENQTLDPMFEGLTIERKT